nr:hypothetical protein Itr_chr03CG08670 [Ipomoea trifida]
MEDEICSATSLPPLCDAEMKELEADCRYCWYYGEWIQVFCRGIRGVAMSPEVIVAITGRQGHGERRHNMSKQRP